MTGSTEPTKLTQVTADLSDMAPSTAMVNMGGGEVVEDEAREVVSEEVKERVSESEYGRRHGENEIIEEGIYNKGKYWDFYNLYITS